MALEGQCGFCGNFGHDGLDCPFPTARKVDAAEERARIRKELLEAINSLETRIDWRFRNPDASKLGDLSAERLRAALDRICPEGKE